MTALTADRNTPARTGQRLSLPVAAATTIHAGAIVCADASGTAVPGAADATLRALGRAAARADNAAGLAGAITVEIDHHEVYRWANATAGDAITGADIGRLAWVVDDQTVARTDGSGARPPAGRIIGVDTLGVWVKPADVPPVVRLSRTVTLTGISSPIALNVTATDTFVVTGLEAGDRVVGESYAGTQDGAVHAASVSGADELTVRTVNASGAEMTFGAPPVVTLDIARSV